MAFKFLQFFHVILLPPTALVIMGILGLILLKRVPRLGRTLVALEISLLFILSIPAFPKYVEQQTFSQPEPLQMPLKSNQAEAIVILGGGIYRNAPEYHGDTVSAVTLVRLRYGAKLSRESGLPIMVCGGKPHGTELSEAEAMRRVLEHDFGKQTRWIEDKSMDTVGNAHESYQILSAEGIRRIYLVTHAHHISRAVRLFEAAGFGVIPAPTQFSAEPTSLNAWDFVPSVRGLYMSNSVITGWLKKGYAYFRALLF